ncbi:MAG: glutamate racemase [Clostridiales bacterium]|nr:glutamate racemase [Clostridiales bacterium]
MPDGYIAFFDSGVGGLPVMAKARAVLPAENFLYFADALRAPYGQKSKQEICSLMKENIDFLLSFGLKAAVLACNTATSAAVDFLRETYTIPILGLEPALKPAVQQTGGRIAVLGTTLTLREEKFAALLRGLGENRYIVPLACPDLARLIEQDTQNPLIGDYLREMLAPHAEGLEGIVLGCSHYNFAAPVLRELFPQARIFDGSDGVVRRLENVLRERGLFGGGSGQILWETSLRGGEKEAYLAKCRRCFDRLSAGQSENGPPPGY